MRLLSDYSYADRGFYNVPLILDPEKFDFELQRLLDPADGTPGVEYDYTEPFLRSVALPMLIAFRMRKDGMTVAAIELLHEAVMATAKEDMTEAWKTAGWRWMLRRA